MHAISGYQLHYTLEGGGTLLIQAEPPEHVRIIATRPDLQRPPGEPSLIQESHVDPKGCELLLYGENLEETAQRYIEMYRYAFGDPSEMTVLPPGTSRYFTLGGTEGYRPVALIVQASPPEHIETIIRARLPDGRTAAVPLLQERILDPEGYAAFMSNTGVDEVAKRYILRYEGRYGRVVEDSPPSASAGDPGGAMSAILTSRWGWVVPVLVGLALIAGLLWAQFFGGGFRARNHGVAPSAPPIYHHTGHGRGH